MQLHLFSSPGSRLLRDIVEASMPFLAQQANPCVAYLPAGSLGYRYIELTETAFQEVARVEVIDPVLTGAAEARRLLERASMLYIPGGNTFVLKHRVQRAGLWELIARRVRDDLPLVGFSAGAICCGPNILTTMDINCCACSDFRGFGFMPYNLGVHYPTGDGAERELADQRFAQYHIFHTNPVLALEDGAYLRVSEQQVELVRGTCWLIEAGKTRMKVPIGVLEAAFA
jgi:peptidase E